MPFHSDLLKEGRCLLLRIAVGEHCVYVLLTFFSSTLIGGPVHRTWNFECATALAKSSIFLPLPRGIHALVADFGLLSVLQGLQFDYRDTYLTYHGSRTVDWDDEDYVVWSP